MISQPGYAHRINADEWISVTPENWQEHYEDNGIHKLLGSKIFRKYVVPNIDGLKTAEKEMLLDNIFTTGYMAIRKNDLSESKNLATALRDKVYVYNDKEPTVSKAYSEKDANLDGSKPNALLHTMWSALLTYEFDDNFAKKITTAHEMLDKEQYANNKIYSQPEIASEYALVYLLVFIFYKNRANRLSVFMILSASNFLLHIVRAAIFLFNKYASFWIVVLIYIFKIVIYVVIACFYYLILNDI